jgi:hypothetical protein
MKYLVPFLLVFTTSVKAQKIHFKSVLVDTHNDAVTACIEKKVSLDQNLKGMGALRAAPAAGGPPQRSCRR